MAGLTLGIKLWSYLNAIVRGLHYHELTKAKFSFITHVAIAFFIVILITNVECQAFEQKQGSNKNPYINGPQLLFNHPDHGHGLALPLDITADIQIAGLIAYAEIKQIFINPYPLTLEGKYQFPLPENAAVRHLNVLVGDKEIIGQIMEKQAAKRVYEKSKQQGKKAALMEQQRPNLFTNNIANIPGHSTVVVTLKFTMPIDYANGRANFRLPLAITTRYQPNEYEVSPAHATSQIMAPVANTLAESQASVNVMLNAGIPVNAISSPSHQITTKSLDHNMTSYLITLDKSHEPANKSFVLDWQLEDSSKPLVSSFTEQIGEEHFTLLNIFPPIHSKISSIARDVIFIIDTSGSMQGDSIRQAKASLLEAISNLTESDSFNIIAFESHVDVLFSATQMVSGTNIKRAKQFIKSLSANGGTEMYRPLSQALTMRKSEDQTVNAVRQIIFVTDGAVANEFELMHLLNGAPHNFRLFTVGIGAAPNGYFMRKAAQFGRGSYEFIQNNAEVANKISALMKKISQPVVTDIRLSFNHQDATIDDIYPRKVPDLYLGEPIQISIKTKKPISQVQLLGKMKASLWQHQLNIEHAHTSQGVSTIWARRKIAELLDSLVTGAAKEDVKKEVIATSIAHQILSPYTSFIAVEKQRSFDSLYAKVPNKNRQGVSQNLAKTYENLTVALPQTALNWHQQLLFGLLLVIIGFITNKLWKNFRNEHNQ